MTSANGFQEDDDIYGGIEVGEYERPESLRDKFESFGSRVKKGAKDVFEQGIKGLFEGALGSYGDISSLVGANPEEGHINPGEAQQYQNEFQTLQKMDKPGYKPSISDIYSLSDLNVGQTYSRLPTSGEIGQKIEEFGGPGEAQTPEGAFAGRAAKIYSGGAAFGQLNPVPALAAAGAGETVKGAGGGHLAQAASEIVTLMATQGKSLPVTSLNKAIRERIDKLRGLGFSDQDITLALNGAKRSLKGTRGAKATSASEKAFKGTLEKSEGLFDDIINQAFPGLEKGTKHVHELASDIYGEVARDAKKVKITNSQRFEKTIDNVTKQLRNNLGDNPESASLLKRLEDAGLAAQSNPNADTYINFYKELNQMGKWLDPKNRERLLTHVKNGIKSTFRNSGPEGKQLAEKFEKANAGIRRAYQAQEVSDLLATAQTAEGIDWNKTLKLFDKQKNWKILEDGLGTTQTKNLREIAKAAKNTTDLRNSLGSLQSSGKLHGWIATAKGAGFLYALANNHYKTAGLIAASSAGKAGYKRLQTRLLTDPKFQNIFLRTLNAIKTNSPQALQRSSDALRKVAEEEGIDVDSF